MKKYSFTGETKILDGIEFKRIKAEISFGVVVAGELGGWIEKQENLSQDGDAWVYGNAEVYGNARVSGNAEVCGNARVYGNAWVSGDAWVSGNAEVSGDAEVSGNADVLTTSNIGSRNGTVTFFKSKLGIEVNCGCFLGRIEQFEERVKKTHRDNKHSKVYLYAIAMAKLQIESEGTHE